MFEGVRRQQEKSSHTLGKESLSPVSNSAKCHFMNPASHLTFIQIHLLSHEMETV